LSSSSDEQILAQEEGVINRPAGVRGEFETAFDFSDEETEGTLVLTTTRLLYVHGGETREDIPVGMMSKRTTYFTDVEDLRDIPADLHNLTIQLSSVTRVVGHHAMAMSPKLEVTWTQGGTSRTTEFVQQVTGGSRKKNLNDWAPVIERLKAGKESVAPMAESPDDGTLDSKVLHALGDMQEKGLLTLESELELKYNVELEPEDVEAACQRLISQGLVRSTGGKDEPPFYQKVSALGSDALDQ
jgi:hypothetical protein